MSAGEKTEKEIRDWAKDLIIQAKKMEGVDRVRVWTSRDEAIKRARELNAAIAREEGVMEGEDQAAMLYRYFWKNGWISEMDEICKDRGLKVTAKLKRTAFSANQGE